MRNLDYLTEKSIPTINMVGLSLLTVGIYPYLWLYDNIESFGSFSRKAYSRWSVIIGAALFAWQAPLSAISNAVADPYSSSGIGISMFLGLIGITLSIGWYVFHFAVITMPSLKGLSDHLLVTEKIDLRINGFFAFIFAYLYMNYKINELADLRKRKALLG